MMQGYDGVWNQGPLPLPTITSSQVLSLSLDTLDFPAELYPKSIRRHLSTSRCPLNVLCTAFPSKACVSLHSRSIFPLTVSQEGVKATQLHACVLQ